MYKCERCKRTSFPRQGMHKVAIEQRKKVYYSKELKLEGEGFETVREAAFCLECATAFKNQTQQN